jgi:hypothetical protein
VIAARPEADRGAAMPAPDRGHDRNITFRRESHLPEV